MCFYFVNKKKPCIGGVAHGHPVNKFKTFGIGVTISLAHRFNIFLAIRAGAYPFNTVYKVFGQVNSAKGFIFRVEEKHAFRIAPHYFAIAAFMQVDDLVINVIKIIKFKFEGYSIISEVVLLPVEQADSGWANYPHLSVFSFKQTVLGIARQTGIGCF